MKNNIVSFGMLNTSLMRFSAVVTGALALTPLFKDVPADANGNIRGSVARKGAIARLAGLQIQGNFKKLIKP